MSERTKITSSKTKIKEKKKKTRKRGKTYQKKKKIDFKIYGSETEEENGKRKQKRTY